MDYAVVWQHAASILVCKLSDDGRRPKYVGVILIYILIEFLKFSKTDIK
jgi:hypothetical protein